MVRRGCDGVWSAAILVGVVVAAACKREPERHATASANATASASATASANASAKPAKPSRLPALAAKSWLVDLEVAGFDRAALAVPIGATGPRSILVALHGFADRPEWTCGAFRGIAGPKPFVLCPRGVRRHDPGAPEADPRFTFGSADDTARELRAALAALKREYGGYIAPGPVVFAGFEVGADQAAWIARQEPAFFSRLLLIEPGESTWSPSDAALFGRLGGARVLFASRERPGSALALKARLTERAGTEARYLTFAADAPPLGPASVSALASNFAWLSSPTKANSETERMVPGNSLSAEEPPAPLGSAP